MPNEKVEVNEEEQLLIINRLHQVLQPFLLRIEELLGVQDVRTYLGSYKHINYRLLYETKCQTG